MNALAFFVLIGVWLLLAVFGAGIWIWTVCVAAVAAGAAYAAAAARRRGAEAEDVFPALSPGIEPLALIAIAFLLFTALPLPHVLNAPAGAPRTGQNARVVQALHDAAQLALTDPSTPWFALSRNRAGTLRIALLAAAMFGAAMLARGLALPWKRAYLRFLSVAGAGLAVAGYIGQWRLPQGDTLWWLFPIPHGLPGPVGCFVNRNHFGGFLALLTPLALALAVDDVRRRRVAGALVSSAAFVAISGALLMCLSRGAYVAYAAGLLATGLLLLLRRRWLAVALLVGLAAVAVPIALRAPPAAVQQRIESMRNADEDESLATRMTTWRETLRIWRAYPLIGAGANAFRIVYPQHRVTSTREWVTHPENEYVQTLAETGLAGVALLAAFVLAIGWRLVAPAGGGRMTDPVAVAGCGALAVAAVHAGFDFALHAPLYAVTLASLVGLALPQETGPRGAAARAAPGLAVCLAALLCLPFLRPIQNLDAQSEFRTADLTAVRRALVWAPTSWEAWYNFGMRCWAGDSAAARALAERCVTQAAAYDPNNYQLWMELGKLRLAVGDPAGARAAFARVRQLRSWVEIPRVPP